MLSLLIEDNHLTIKDLEKNELDIIIKWFQGSEFKQYKYAMGIDKPLTYEDLFEKYLEALISAHEFFLSIIVNGNTVGFIKGRVNYGEENEVWIMAFLIDSFHQNLGIGRRSLQLFIDEFGSKFGVKSFFAFLVKDNMKAVRFWENNGFVQYRLSKGYFTMDNISHDLIIMQKYR